MKDTDLKHLTLKTAFLLALASGKRRSKIHARVANKVSNLGQWGKVALFPSSDFIAKNQVAREGSQSVSPVTIPGLTTIVDRQFKEDRTLCPVWALRYYLDRTKDLRGYRSLLFISFKKGHTSDIRPATHSFWLKESILLCYKQADQQALDLVQVKVHDIRAFVASKAFYGGVSVDQIMQDCHWKAHNTFINFYLKDLTWSDNDNNMYLGPVVAAQQVLDPSSQTSYPRKEKKEGANLLQPSPQQSNPRVSVGFPLRKLWVRSVKLVSDKLIFKGQLYTTDTVHKLPSMFQPETVASPSKHGTTAFFTSSSPLSNHHRSFFQVGKKVITV